MRKYIVILLLAILCLIGIGYTGICAYFYYGQKDSIEESLTDIQQRLAKANTIITFGVDDFAIVPDSELTDFSYNIEEVGFFESLFSEPVLTTDVQWNYDKITDKLKGWYKAATNASIVYDDAIGYSLVQDTDSYSFNIAEVANYILSFDPLIGGMVSIADYKIGAEVTADSLQEEFERLSAYNGFHITYTDGTSLTLKDLQPYMDNLEELSLSGIHDKLDNSYTTAGGFMSFITTAGERLTVDYGTYGETLSWKLEEKFIRESIASATSCDDRRPLLSGYDDFQDSYIEISISDQHVWHYVDGELCCETDCVTGNKGNHDTPKGVYYISECIDGKYLIGDDYKTWVNKWMRLTPSGVGLHDAYWRGKFGGNIYTYNGSHGCINLPKAYAYQLFKEVKNGYPVVIY